MQHSYLFYDIETTGLNKAFDQVMQFAAIRTDEHLNEIDRHELLVKINPDIIPSPYALITHRISLEKAAEGVCEYEAICKIHQWMNQPNTISLGYNTLGFDDEFLRFSFYKNLLPPYTHQYANGCGRMDLYPMTALSFLFNKNVIEWPEIDGIPSLKLEHLSSQNQLATGAAHNAMVDVEATLALAKKFKQKDEIWHYLSGYFNKATDSTRQLKLPKAFNSFAIAILIDGAFGEKNSYQTVALSLGTHYHYGNQTLWLRLDDPALTTMTKENFEQIVWVIRKKIGETYLTLPFIERYQTHLSTERREIINQNLHFLKSNPELLNVLAEHYRNQTYPTIPDLDVDAALYQNGFPTHYEKELCREFHEAPVDQKSTMIDRMTNSHLKTQMIRLLGRNYPEQLPKEYQEQFTDYVTASTTSEAPITDHRNAPKLTKTTALAEAEELLASETLDDQQTMILTDFCKEYAIKPIKQKDRTHLNR